MKILKLTFFSLLAGILLLSCFTTAKTASSSEKPVHNAITSPPAGHYQAQILSYLNELRLNPSAFYHKYVKDYIKKKADRFTSYYTSSLKRTLLHQQPLPPFKTNAILQNLASRQLHYLVHTLKGRSLTHNQGNISFAERIKGTGLHCFAENLYRFPKATALEVVLDLLIDQGVSSLGHRKNLLNPRYTLIGIESAVAPNNYKVTVMDFGCVK